MKRCLRALNAPARGFEPRIADPKSAVLPLHHAGLVLSGNAKELAPSPLNKQHALAVLLVAAAEAHGHNIQGEPAASPVARIPQGPRPRRAPTSLDSYCL